MDDRKIMTFNSFMVSVSLTPEVMRKVATRLLGSNYYIPKLFYGAQVTYGINVYNNPPLVPFNNRCEPFDQTDNNANNGTQVVYTVPADKVMYVYYVTYRSSTAAQTYKVYAGDSTAAADTPLYMVDTYGQQYYHFSYPIPLKIMGGTPIKHYVSAGATGELGIHGWLEDAQ